MALTRPWGLERSRAPPPRATPASTVGVVPGWHLDGWPAYSKEGLTVAFHELLFLSPLQLLLGHEGPVSQSGPAGSPR